MVGGLSDPVITHFTVRRFSVNTGAQGVAHRNRGTSALRGVTSLRGVAEGKGSPEIPAPGNPCRVCWGRNTCMQAHRPHAPK